MMGRELCCSCPRALISAILLACAASQPAYVGSPPNFKVNRRDVDTLYLTKEEQCRPRHFAICFFGITRSLGQTISSIQHHVFAPITRAGSTYDVMLHTYNVTHLPHNPRAGEVGVQQNFSEFVLLNPTVAEITSQEAFDATVDIKEYTKFSMTDYPAATVVNILRQANSLASVWRLLEGRMTETGTVYDGVIFLRPDVLYLNDIDVTKYRMDDRYVFVPAFQSWNGVNDRFAYGTPKVMRIYSNRMEGIKAYCQKWVLHAEGFLRYHLESHDISCFACAMRFARLRVTGEVAFYDQGLVENPEQPIGIPAFIANAASKTV